MVPRGSHGVANHRLRWAAADPSRTGRRGSVTHHITPRSGGSRERVTPYAHAEAARNEDELRLGTDAGVFGLWKSWEQRESCDESAVDAEDAVEVVRGAGTGSQLWGRGRFSPGGPGSTAAVARRAGGGHNRHRRRHGPVQRR